MKKIATFLSINLPVVMSVDGSVYHPPGPNRPTFIGFASHYFNKK